MNSPVYPAESSALVLIDVLNDFLAEDGKINGMIGPMRDELNLIPTLERLLAGAREAGLTIVYAPHGLDEHSFDNIKHLHPRMQMGLDNQVFWKGSYGADFYPSLRPHPGDIVASRHRMSNSFFGTDLNAQMQQRGIEKIILAGLTSSSCVEATGRHAIEEGYHVTFLTDAVADFAMSDHRAAVEISYPKFGHAALTVADFLQTLREPGG